MNASFVWCCIRAGFYTSEAPTIAELVEDSDDKLFRNILTMKTTYSTICFLLVFPLAIITDQDHMTDSCFVLLTKETLSVDSYWNTFINQQYFYLIHSFVRCATISTFICTILCLIILLHFNCFYVDWIYTPCLEKGATLFLPLTLPNAD